MRYQLTASVLLAAVGLVVACEDNPVEPPSTGTISLNLVVLPYPAPAAGPPASTEDSAQGRADLLTDVPDEPERLERRGEPGGDPEAAEELPQAEPTLEVDIPAGAAPAADSTAAALAARTAAFDAARVRVIGPTNKEVNLTLNSSTDRWEGTVTDLTPGTYTVVVEGLVSGVVDWYGETTGVQVRAGQNTQATVQFATFKPVIADFTPATTTAFRFTAGVVPLQFADRYWFEWDSNPNFLSPSNSGWVSGTSIEIAVGSTGTYYVRAKAQNDQVAEGSLGDAKQIQVRTDITLTGDDPTSAVYHGFGTAANGTIDEVNIYPANDEDWFSLDACGGDTLIAEVRAERLGTASDLDAYIDVRDSNNEWIGDGDDSFGLDPYLARQLPRDDTYYIIVVSADLSSVGHYELDIEIRAGARNTGGSCVWVPLPTSGPLVFVSDRSGNEEIYLRSAEGALLQLTSDPGRDLAPAFSPDGSRIAFSSDRTGAFDLFVVDADGGNLQQLSSEPAGGTFANTSSWSATGTQLAFRSIQDGDAEIYVINADGSSPANLTNDPGADISPAWSPDGSKIAWASNRTGDWDIYVMNPDGSGAANLTNSPGVADQAPAWSPDGSQIAYRSDLNSTPGDYRIFLMDADGSFVYQLGDYPGTQNHPAWSPTGSEIAFSSPADGDTDVYIVQADGSNRSNVTESSYSDDDPAWQPSGGPLPPVTAASVEVTPGDVLLGSVGANQAFTAAARNAGGSLILGKAFNWTSLNPEVAPIDALTGVVTAVASGQVTIAAEVDGVYGYALVTVRDPGLPQVNLWSLESNVTGFTGFLTGVWGFSAWDIFAVGFGGTVVRYDGSTWNTMANPGGQYQDVWGSSADDVFAVGDGGRIVHYDGSSWTTMTSGTTANLYGVWGAAPNDVFVVGGGGEINHYDGSSWTPMATPVISQVNAIWGVSSTDVFAVGENGVILHYDGASWTQMASGTIQYLTSVWGATATDVWTVNFSSETNRYNGAAWSSVAGAVGGLRGVRGTSATDVYAVGQSGSAQRWNGASWSLVDLGTTETFFGGPWIQSKVPVHAVGTNGSVLRGYRNGTVTVSPSSVTLTAVDATIQLIAEAWDASANFVPGVPFDWTSSNTAVATVDATGLVTAKGNGTATITATAAGGAIQTATITVNQVALVVDTIAYGTQAIDTIPVAGQVHAYNFDSGVLDGIMVFSRAWAPLGLDPDVSLSPINGGTVGGDNDALATADGVGEWIATISDAAGTKTIEVGGATSTTGGYDVVLQKCFVFPLSWGQTLSDSLYLSDCQAHNPESDQQFTRGVFAVFGGSAGDSVLIDLSSPHFDTMVFLFDPDGSVVDWDDDDDDGTGLGSGGLNSLLVVPSLPGSGTYIVFVTSYSADLEGAFTLRISGSGGSAPPALAPASARPVERSRAMPPPAQPRAVPGAASVQKPSHTP